MAKARRDFLKLSALGAAAAALPWHSALLWAEPPSEIEWWVTHGENRMAPGVPLQWRQGTPVGEAITLDPSQKFQLHPRLRGSLHRRGLLQLPSTLANGP
jgi:hypothetical protein